MRTAMLPPSQHGNCETRCDARVLSTRHAAGILCDVLPQCEITSDCDAVVPAKRSGLGHKFCRRPRGRSGRRPERPRHGGFFCRSLLSHIHIRYWDIHHKNILRLNIFWAPLTFKKDKAKQPLQGSSGKMVSYRCSRGNKRDKMKGTNGAKYLFAVHCRFSLIFEDFRSSWE